MPGTHPREFATVEDSEEIYVGLGKGARDMLGLRTRWRDDAVTDESPKINLLCLENASVECRNRRRRTCRRRSFISEKSGRFHKPLLSVIAIAPCYVCVNTQLWRIFRGHSICTIHERNRSPCKCGLSKRIVVASIADRHQSGSSVKAINWGVGRIRETLRNSWRVRSTVETM